MREFFIDDVAGIPFNLFGWVHFLCIAVTLVGLFYIYINRDKIVKMNYNVKKKIKLLIVIIMFLNMKLYYIPLLLYGRYDWTNHLPLHFCFISGYLFMFALLTDNRRLYKLTYFFSFMGPIPAILLPDSSLASSFDSFLFYQYFISHHFFLVANSFIFYAYNHHFSLNDVKRAFFVSNVIFVTMALFNFVFKTNYIMSNSLPPHVIELFPFLRNVQHPFIILEITGMLILVIAYIPIYFRNKEKTLNSGLQPVESLL
jgi:hypothetical integral membrane protein (TIGR02206 family)